MTKILIIEDEPTLREDVKQILGFEGFEVFGAPDGWQGIQAARDHHPDLILCDIMMPELDGYGVLIELQSDWRTSGIPFVFLTARADKSAMRQGMELGADDYLTKPFTHDELLRAINTRLAKQQAIDDRYSHKLDQLREAITLTLPHELRTPLTGILGYASYMLSAFDDLQRDEIRTMVQSIERFGNRLLRLIENYLIYTQFRYITVDDEQRRMLCQHYAQNPTPAADEISRVATDKGAALNREADLELNVQDIALPVSSENLVKIADELIDNAFKFSNPGTPVQVELSTENATCYFRVSDRGRGMELEQVSEIEAFMQFERDRYEQQGSGMGLVIAKLLTDFYNGMLTIQSEPGAGTVIEVSFPCGD